MAKNELAEEQTLGTLIAHSNNSPSPLDCPVLLACLPSTLSMVEYLCKPTISTQALH